jgi:hypothetical protein
MWSLIIMTLLQPEAEIFNDQLTNVSGNVLNFPANLFFNFKSRWIALKNFTFKVSPKKKYPLR